MLRIFCLLTLFVIPVLGQGTSLLFSTDGTEVAASGAGGTSMSPGNYTAVFRDECLLTSVPGSAPNAAALAHRSTWAAWFGDDDGDGNFTEGVAGNLDVAHLRAGAPNPPAIHDVFVSFSNDAGPAGNLQGVSVKDGDVFRILPGSGIDPFITEAQVALSMGTTADIDVNAFTMDPATGDLYWSLTTSHSVNGIMLQDGGLIRLPASGYTATAAGTVASVTSGAAQIALFEAHLDVFYATAGLGTVGDIDGVAIDPAGGTFIGPLGIALPHFWFVADSPTSGPAIVSSQGSGSVPSISGTAMAGGPAFGLGSTDWGGGINSTISALAIVPFTPSASTRMLNTPEPALVTPGQLTIDVGGANPGAGFYLLANLATTAPAGSFTGRTIYPSLSSPGGTTELYVDDFGDPLFLFTFGDPPILIDSEGYGSRTWPVPAIPPGLGLTFQGIDAASGALSMPVIVVTQ